jgi:hypothetical protein
MPKTDDRYAVNSLEDVQALIDKHFPDGLEAARKEDFFNGGWYVGFNLSRYGYVDRLAAELHAARDTYLGKVGHSYGAPFRPHVQTHKATDGKPEWYEVYTE